LENDVDQIFEDYLAAHADDVKIDFAPLLQKHPHLKIELERNITGYRKIMGIFSDDTPLATSSMVGEEIGGCRIVKMLGQGGMGIAYLARQEKLGRDVVVKILRPFAVDNPTLKERFERESRVIAKLDHKGIVPVYDIGEQNGSLYILMKHVDGVPLNRLIEGLSGIDRSCLKMMDVVKTFQDLFPGKLAPDLAVRHKSVTEFFCHLVIQTAEALQYAHDNGIIHRDVKPSNIILEPDGNPVILDFGLSHDEMEVNLTVSGEFLGTPVYSAPESFGKGGTLDLKKLDVYSLGVSMYELLTGKLPYEGTSIYEIYNNVRHKEPIKPTSRWKILPRDLETVILKSISKDQDYRYASIFDLRQDLDHFLNYRPIIAKSPSYAYVTKLWLHRRKKVIFPILAIITILIAIASILNYRATRINRMNHAASLAENSYGDFLSGRIDQAIEKMEKAIQLAPESKKDWSLRLISYKMKKDLDYDKALLEIENLGLGEDADALYLVMQIYSLTKKYSEAINAGKHILEIEQKYEVYRMLPNLLWQVGERAQAIYYADKGLKIWPEDSDLNFTRATMCEGMGDMVCAENFFSTAAKKNDEYLKDYGGFLFRNKDYTKAIDTLEAFVQYSQRDPLVFQILAFMYLDEKKCQLAADRINHAKRLEPLNEAIKSLFNKIVSECNIGSMAIGGDYDTLKQKKRGYDLLIQGKIDDAVGVFNEILMYVQNDDQVYEGLGLALTKQGYYQAAISYFEKATKLTPGSKKILDSIKIHLQGVEQTPATVE
jgi:serine/threonine protein kinase/Flp pilus assembly protein TadD